MKVFGFLVATCLATTKVESHCCPNAKVYIGNLETVAYLRSVDRNLIESTAKQDSACVTQRDGLTLWKSPSTGDYWEVQEHFAEAEFTRAVVDFLGVGEGIYWNAIDASVPRMQRVIALKAKTNAVFNNDWKTYEESSVSSICQAGTYWTAADLVRALEDKSGWLVILANKEVLEGWLKWQQDFVKFAGDRCGHGCLLAVVEDTGSSIDDVLGALAGVETSNNNFGSCVPCEYRPSPATPQNYPAYVYAADSGLSAKLQPMFWLVLTFVCVH